MLMAITRKKIELNNFLIIFPSSLRWCRWLFKTYEREHAIAVVIHKRHNANSSSAWQKKKDHKNRYLLDIYVYVIEIYKKSAFFMKNKALFLRKKASRKCNIYNLAYKNESHTDNKQSCRPLPLEG